MPKAMSNTVFLRQERASCSKNEATHLKIGVLSDRFTNRPKMLYEHE